MSQPAKGCVIAAPHSGAGKTLVTLGLIRALKQAGHRIKSAKVGPDYIDPAFHALASGALCVNLDVWAMGEGVVRTLAGVAEGDALIIEGVMGLFDGANDGTGSTADIAEALNLPVILVVDAYAQSWSAAALLYGFKNYRPEINVAAVIFNHVGSARHASLLKKAAEKVDLPVLGCLPRNDKLSMPSRHLGLVQAQENADIDDLINHAAIWVADNIDLPALVDLFMSLPEQKETTKNLAPLGQRIAVARDAAFSFLYTHILEGWQQAGAEIVPFSPLADEGPDKSADAVFLPGGYPELHAATLCTNSTFLNGLRLAAKNALIYGECGGFMVLGETLIDAQGTAHQMAGLLPVTTSFKNRARHLGYRKLSHESPLPWPKHLRGHEFHYSTLINQGEGSFLFQARDAIDTTLPPMGLQVSRILGSYAHIISAEAQP